MASINTTAAESNREVKGSGSLKIINLILGVPIIITSTLLQSLKQSPFETHRVHVTVILIAVIIYIGALIFQFKYSHDPFEIVSAVASEIGLVSGLLVIIVIIIILEQALGWVVLGLFAIWIVHNYLYLNYSQGFYLQALLDRARSIVAGIKRGFPSSAEDSQVVAADSDV